MIEITVTQKIARTQLIFRSDRHRLRRAPAAAQTQEGGPEPDREPELEPERSPTVSRRSHRSGCASVNGCVRIENIDAAWDHERSTPLQSDVGGPAGTLFIGAMFGCVHMAYI